jgi:hypothetical protein
MTARAPNAVSVARKAAQVKRYALLYLGDGKRPSADVKAIGALPGITIISDKDSRVMIVEGPRSVMTAVNKMANWAAGEQQLYHVDPPAPFGRASR